jgi:hypothetical protein
VLEPVGRDLLGPEQHLKLKKKLHKRDLVRMVHRVKLRERDGVKWDEVLSDEEVA